MQHYHFRDPPNLNSLHRRHIKAKAVSAFEQIYNRYFHFLLNFKKNNKTGPREGWKLFQLEQKKNNQNDSYTLPLMSLSLS